MLHWRLFALHALPCLSVALDLVVVVLDLVVVVCFQECFWPRTGVGSIWHMSEGKWVVLLCHLACTCSSAI